METVVAEILVNEAKSKMLSGFVWGDEGWN
jgi:hypothetical protein